MNAPAIRSESESEREDDDQESASAGLKKAAFAAAEEPAPAGEQPRAAADREKVMVTGSVTVITEDVAGLAAAIRGHAIETGGSVSREEIGGDAQHRQAEVVLRLPPAVVSAFVDWLATRAVLESRYLQSSDVTRQYFDRELAIRNLEVTTARLHELAKRPNAELKDVIAVEHELTRVRGELEQLRGEQRLLGDRVARATLTVSIHMKHGVHAEPELKFELVPHLTFLHLVDAGARSANRTGGGVSMMFSRWFTLDFETLPRKGGDARSYLFTMTTATYSDFLGGGRRRFLNPYLGARLGGAKVNGLGALAFGADVGFELVRFKLFLLEAAGRVVGLWYNRDSAPANDVVLEGVLGVGVPF